MDGEVFDIVEEGHDGQVGTVYYTWLTRHDGQYGFSSHGPGVNLNHEERIRAFLAAIDPDTGYLPDTD